jgi:hypothetical protein
MGSTFHAPTALTTASLEALYAARLALSSAQLRAARIRKAAEARKAVSRG